MKKPSLRMAGPLFGLALLSGALWILFHELRHYHYRDIALAVKGIPQAGILVACGLTAINYLALTGYDALAFRYIRQPIPYRLVGPASFVAYSFSNNVGFALLSGGAVRYRLYSAWGVSAGNVTRIIAFCSATYWLGNLTVGGLAFLLGPPAPPKIFHLSAGALRPVGVLLLGLLIAYLILSFARKEPFRFKSWEFSLPSPGVALSQVVVAALDLCLATAVLYTLLPAGVAVTYPHFLGIFILGLLFGTASHVPGGLGVFETAILLMLSDKAETTAILGSLLVFRAIYYLLPLLIASASIAAYELYSRRKAVETVTRRIGEIFGLVVPQFIAAATFLGGAILLFSGATPSIHGRLAVLDQFLPLPVIEFSHFLSSLAGAALLILARGIQRRLDSACLLSLVLLALGAVWSLLKGLDYEEAAVLTTIFFILLSSRRHFFRKASLISERFTPGWILLIAAVLICSAWLGLFSYKHVEYSHDLWWQFALHSDAPRFIRAGVGVVCLTSLFALARLLKPAPVNPSLPSAEELELGREIYRNNPYTIGNLALLGDKSLLFSESRKAFIMYGVEKRSWVALGDPIGPKEEAEELAWNFREMSHLHGGWTVFYQVRPDYLPLYLDLGLTLTKLGEEARILLKDFSLEGAAHKQFRRVLNYVEREGGEFDFVPAGQVESLLPDLKIISDTWLREKNTREKRFSLGYFAEDYLRHQTLAVVRQAGRVVAFVNLCHGEGKEELSVDLMRYVKEAPDGIMEYLFLKLMLWGQAEGYRWFNLGMAPLSGLEDRALAPLWNQIGAILFRHGEHFYNFRGLRLYKEKFHPVWEPRYLASPGGFALPQILTHLAALTSGGLRGVVTR